MKKIFLLIALSIGICVNAQVSNLAELATGKIELFSPIMNIDESIYGYFSIFNLEKTEDNKQRYEYVILDKNLNKVANGEFEDVNYKGINSFYFYPEKIENKLVITKRYTHNFHRRVMFTSHRTLDLEKNEISEPFYYDGEAYVEGNREANKLNKRIRKIKEIDIPLTHGNGFLKIDVMKEALPVDRTIGFASYDASGEKQWENVFNGDLKSIQKSFNIINDKDFVFSVKDKMSKSVKIHRIDPSNGVETFSYEIENKESKYSHIYYMQKTDGGYTIVGKMSEFSNSGYSYKRALGLFRILLDENGKEVSKKYFLWNQAAPELEMNKYGRLDKRYQLAAKSYFVFKNGTISVLTEKRKENFDILFGGTNVKTLDFVILNFDKDFNFINTNTIEKDKSKWAYSDFLYSQKVKGGEGVVFFYNDYKKDLETKKKNWILGIVSIVNGKLNHEQIPMSSKEHFISPYIAKEGYILLREFNKDSEYNEIRLEKINY